MVVIAGFEDPSAHIQRLGRDSEPACDLLQDLGARLSQSAFDLAQVRIRDARALTEVAQRKSRIPPLLADELAEIAEPALDRLGHKRPPTFLVDFARYVSYRRRDGKATPTPTPARPCVAR